MNNPILIGENTYLRPIEKADAPLFVAWLNDPEVSRFTQQYLPLNLRQEEEYLARLYQDKENVILGIVERATDRLLGAAGFHQIDWRNRQTGFGIVIGAKDAWGKGHGAETTRLMLRYAFATLNLHRVWLRVYSFNERAMRCYEKVGFQREGVLRQDVFRDGRYWDTIMMSVLRDERPG